MSSAREIIGATFAHQHRNVCYPDVDQVERGIAADAIIKALEATGFRILAPDELDPATVERCAQVVEHDDRSERAKGVGFIPDWLHHARRKAAELRTLTGGNNGR